MEDMESTAKWLLKIIVIEANHQQEWNIFKKGKEVFLGTPEPYYGNNAPILLLQYGIKTRDCPFMWKLGKIFATTSLPTETKL